MKGKITIVPSRDGRLDHLIIEEICKLKDYSEISRSLIEKTIKTSNVTVDGVIVTKPGAKIKNNSKVEIDIQEIPEHDYIHAEAQNLDIIYEDDEILVINKGSRVVVHPGAGNKSGTLLSGIKHYFLQKQIEAPIRYGLVHRLDRDTTGVLILAKNNSALKDLQKQFSDRTVRKIYSGICYIPPKGDHALRENESIEIDKPIGRDSSNRTKMSVSLNGKASKSKFTVIERLFYSAYVNIQIYTGRTHQIRVHLESIRSCIIGDTLYSQRLFKPQKLIEAIKSFKGLALHSKELTVIHPKTKNEVKFEAKEPLEFLNLIKILKENG